MLAVIEDWEAADVICDSIVFHFSRPSEYWKPEFDKRIALFSSEQRAALVAYLRWFGRQFDEGDEVAEAIAVIQAA
jgi:hypothetical protein